MCTIFVKLVLQCLSVLVGVLLLSAACEVGSLATARESLPLKFCLDVTCQTRNIRGSGSDLRIARLFQKVA